MTEPTDPAARFDVVPDYRRQQLRLVCDCGWEEAQDPGGPTLATLIRRAKQHDADAHGRTEA